MDISPAEWEDEKDFLNNLIADAESADRTSKDAWAAVIKQRLYMLETAGYKQGVIVKKKGQGGKWFGIIKFINVAQGVAEVQRYLESGRVSKQYFTPFRILIGPSNVDDFEILSAPPTKAELKKDWPARESFLTGSSE